MAVQLAPHVPHMARTTASSTAATKALGDALLDVREHVGEIIADRSARSIVEACRALRDTPASNISS